ncbi:MAG: peptidase S9, partial [Gemmatimonadales bacterium]
MRRFCTVGVFLSMLSIFSAPAEAQFFAFGQNKVQYRRLDWRVTRGPHVDLYYYPAEADLVPAALAYAEASYDTLSLQFGHAVATRIPLIVYASHTDFEQTNILPFTPPEGLLGA